MKELGRDVFSVCGIVDGFSADETKLIAGLLVVGALDEPSMWTDQESNTRASLDGVDFGYVEFSHDRIQAARAAPTGGIRVGRSSCTVCQTISKVMLRYSSRVCEVRAGYATHL